MGLTRPSTSLEAKASVADIINIIEQSEQRQSARKEEDESAFSSVVGLIIGDLLIAV